MGSTLRVRDQDAREAQMIAAAAAARKVEEPKRVSVPPRRDAQVQSHWQIWTELVYYEIESGQTKSGHSAFDNEPKLLAADSRFCL
jgi:hypothetical protein